MSGKKGKKTKGKTVPLQDFLSDDNFKSPATPKTNWSECMEEEDDYNFSYRNKEPMVLPTAPRASRDPTYTEEKIPTIGPFVAYISNLPYEVEEQDLHEFFQNLKISHMRLPKDSNKSRGYGYVEFDDRQSLIDAISMADMTLKSRRLKIEPADKNDERRNRTGSRMGEQRRDYGDDPERTMRSWRNAREEGMGDDMGGRDDRFRSRGSGFERNRDDNRDSGFEDNKPGGWRDAPRTSFADRDGDRGRSDRERGDRGDRDRGMGNGSGFGMRRNFGDDLDREKERWSSVRSQARDAVEGPPPPVESARTRPKLNLQPRSKPFEQTTSEKDNEEGSKESVPAPAPTSATNIFGAARPVDTAAREREIEERLAKSAESRPKDEREGEKRSGPREGAWGRRNGEGRDDQERGRPTWRSYEDRGRMDRSGGRQSRPDQRDYRDHREQIESGESMEPRGDSRGPPLNRSGVPIPATRGPPRQIDSRSPTDGAERERKKDKDTEDEISRMPKLKDDEAPNFVASNKYSMLPDDVDPDDVDVEE